MKLIRKKSLVYVLLLIVTLTGCSKKVFPHADYDLLTKRNAKPYSKQGIKTIDNTLQLNSKSKFVLNATDSVLAFRKDTMIFVSNYKEFFADVTPQRNYKISIHSLSNKTFNINKHTFAPWSFVYDKQGHEIKLTVIEKKFAGAFEAPGLKSTFTFNSGDTDQVAIVVFSDNSELDKIVYSIMINFVPFKYRTATTGEFYITIEEIKE